MKKMSNESWHRVEVSTYGVLEPLVNRKKDYTLLYNVDSSSSYVVAYHYDESDNTWGQGHYFNDFYDALEFMFAPVAE